MTAAVVETRGRPTTYRPEYAEQVRDLVFLGAALQDLARFFHVSDTTIENWMKAHPEFLSAIKDAKEEADAQVVKSLYRRALGYSHPAEKIFCDKDGNVTKVPYTEHYPPDTVACIFWLKNRQRQHWRDVHKLEHSGPDGAPLPPQVTLVLVRADSNSHTPGD